MTPPHAFVDAVHRFGRRQCLVSGDRSLTYEQLGELVHSAGENLAGAVPPGAVAAMAAGFCAESVAALLWLLSRPASAALLPPGEPPELAERLRICEAEAFIQAGPGRLEARALPSQGAHHPLLRRLAEPLRPGLVLFSSGSTGEPKAMVHDFARFVGRYPVRAARDFRVVAFLELDHVGGLDTLLRCLSAGMTLVVPDDRTPEAVCEAIERHRGTVLPASPTFLNLLLATGADRRFDLSSLAIIGYGAEPMPEATLRRCRERFPGVRLQQKYGTSETSAVRVRSRSPDSLWMRVDDHGVQHRIVDGELWLRSESQILGYLNAGADASRFTADGWYRTGDLVEEREEEGCRYFRIRGRASDWINVGGRKVMPHDVEAALLELEQVADCRAYPVANAVTGQAVAVEVVFREGVDAADGRRAVLRHCAARLERHKHPVRVEAVASLAAGARLKKPRR